MKTAVKGLLAEVESELKAEPPRFSMETLLGSNIDVFHKNPSYQREMLAKLTKPHSATIRVGGHAFDPLVAPLLRGGKPEGFVVESSNAEERLRNNDYRNPMGAIFSRSGRHQLHARWPDSHFERKLPEVDGLFAE